jgi:hypothetical protein
MKKIIKILQSNTEPLVIEDENEEDLNEYSAKVSKVLSVGNVVILETSSSNVILRPSKIDAIIVTEEGKPKRTYKKKDPVVKEENVIQEDIITDGE